MSQIVPPPFFFLPVKQDRRGNSVIYGDCFGGLSSCFLGCSTIDRGRAFTAYPLGVSVFVSPFARAIYGRFGGFIQAATYRGIVNPGGLSPGVRVFVYPWRV